MAVEPVCAGIELGGTKAVALVARGRSVLERIQLPTGAPEPTLTALADWLDAASARHGGFAALGVASFGPLCLSPEHPDHGRIAKTPKPGWSGVDVLDRYKRRFGMAVVLDTDVNAAALAEGRWGASQGADVHAYLTIGTGVGAGIVVGGRPLHGASHPEWGHVRVRRRAGDSFAGICPWHGDCLEGLVSGLAIAARAGAGAETLAADHPVWTDVTADLAEALAALILTISPQRIVIGGGVGMGQPQILAALPNAIAERLAGYIDSSPAMTAKLLAVAGLGHDAGPLGAIALAMTGLETR